jgi:hypothetical protein
MGNLRLAWCVLVVACSSSSSGGGGSDFIKGLNPATIQTSVDMKAWAGASAPGAYYSGLTGLLLAGIDVGTGSGSGSSAPACPTKTMSGTTTSYEGGCTDDNGRVWFGSATSVGNSATGGTVTYDGFGYDGMTTCMTMMYPQHIQFDGTLTQNIGTPNTFRVDVTTSSDGVNSMTCVTASGKSAVVYSGSFTPTGVDMNGDGTPDGKLWEGSGQFGNTLTGKVSATTVDEVVDNNVCSHEAASGTTTVTAGTDVAVITYDGATDCNTMSTVTWTLDGADQGEITGVSCNSGGTRGSWPLAVALALVLRSRRCRSREARRSTSARSN